MSNVIISGRMNVYTTEVEDVLIQHDGVKDVDVIGVPDDEWDEAVHAFVVPSGDLEPTEAEILEFVDDRLSKYKRPKEIEFLSELPKTAYSKIDKTALEDRYWDSEERRI